MASAKNLLRPFTVEITPEAWRQLVYLPQGTYLALQMELEALAQQVSSERSPLGMTPSESQAATDSSFALDDFTVRYDVDAARRVVRLTEVTRAPHQAPGRTAGTDSGRASE